MKLPLILCFALALPLLAQVSADKDGLLVKGMPEHICPGGDPPPPCDKAEGSKPVPAAKTTVTLSVEDNDTLGWAYMQSLSARVTYLDKLTKDQVGVKEISAADKAAGDFSDLLRAMTKKYLSCDEVTWNFTTKILACAQPAAPPAKP